MKRFRRYLVRAGILLLLLVAAVAAAVHFYQPTIPVVAPPAPKAASGAAVFYNQAFAAMPALSEEEKKPWASPSMGIPLEGPLDAKAAAQYVGKYEKCLSLLAQGAAQQDCEWGIVPSFDQPGQNSYIVNGVKISQPLIVRARLRLTNGDIARTTDDILLLLRFGRHLGKPATEINQIAQFSTEFLAIYFVTRHLQEFDAASLARLSQGFASLPPSPTAREAAAKERELISALFYRQLAAKAFAAGDVSASTPKQAQELKVTGGIGVKALVFWMRRYEHISRELEQLMDLPYAEARPRFAAITRDLEHFRWGNGVFAKLASPGEFLRLKEAQLETVRAIFTAALDAQMYHPGELRARLASFCDPYDGGPIEMRDTESGVQLTLKSGKGRKPAKFAIALPEKAGTAP